MSSPLSSSDRNTLRCQIIFYLADFQLFVMKQRRSKRRVRAAFCQRLVKMLQSSGSSGRDHWNGNSVRYRPGKRNIISGFRTVAVHTGKEDFSCSQTFCFLHPFKGVDPGVQPASVLVDIPAAVFSSLGVHSHDNTLASKFLRGFCDKFRPVYGGGIYRDLIRPFPEKSFEIVNSPDASADRERD